jgi:hypothetical protein
MTEQEKRWHDREMRAAKLYDDLANLGLVEQLGKANTCTVRDWAFQTGLTARAAYRTLLWAGVCKLMSLTNDERMLLRGLNSQLEYVEYPDDLPF